MNILWMLLIGLAAGWLAGVLIRGRGYGVFPDIIIGIVGAVIGGLLFGLFGVDVDSTIGTLTMSVIGAVVLLGIVKAIHKTA